MKKGFTLIELLAVIVILAVLGLLLIPLIAKQLNKSKDELYVSQLENIKDGAKNWSADNIEKLTETENSCVAVKLTELKKQGYVDKKVINPKTKEDFSENFGVKIIFSEGNYKYEIAEDIGESGECAVEGGEINLIPTYSISPSGDVWAQSKTVTIHYPARQENFVYQYSVNGGSSWVTVESGTTATYKFTANGNIIARVYDGNIYHTATTLSVTKIDTEAPTINDFYKSIDNGNLILIGKAIDNKAGISYYQFSTNENLTSSSNGWISITNTKNEITKNYDVSSSGTYYFYVKDAAGNINKKSIVITKSVSLYSNPKKIEYLANEKADYTGLKLKLDYGEGIYEIIDGAPYVISCIEDKSITSGKKYDITVKYESETFYIVTYKLWWYYQIIDSNTNWYYY